MVGQVDKESLTWRVTPDLIGIADASGKFTATNPAWFTTLGRLPEDIESRQFFDFIHPDDIEITQGAFEDLQAGKPVLQFENRYRHKDGSYRWLSWNAVPENGIFFCNARDVTAAKEDAANLLSSRADLKSSTDEAELREQFIAVLGHDMRGPLAAVDAALRVLTRTITDKRNASIIGQAQSSITRMANLLDDVVDFARARMGEGVPIIRQNDCDVGLVIERVVAEIRLAHPEIDVSFEDRFNSSLNCDGDRISQLVSNLMANAITHGQQNRPVRIATWEEDGAFNLSVSNTGGPIPEDVRDTLFEPFTRQDARASMNGLGLGLFIVNQIAIGHGGTMSADSDSEETTFTLTMPIT